MDPVITITGTAVPLDRSDVDTDQIIPSDWLKRVERTGFGAGLFSEWREDPEFVMNLPQFGESSILVAGPNFGVGSSREHAVWALYDGGFRAVIAPSFGDIFFNNALKNGLLPIRLGQSDVSQLFSLTQQNAGTKVVIDLLAQTVVANSVFKASFEIDKFSKQCFLEGLDELGYTLSLLPQIEAFEKKRFS
jgi:3-isopropylmalate/(R)-2-methylmalate dehydratase small subunit